VYHSQQLLITHERTVAHDHGRNNHFRGIIGSPQGEPPVEKHAQQVLPGGRAGRAVALATHANHPTGKSVPSGVGKVRASVFGFCL